MLGPLPAIFGSAAASCILCHLAGRPLTPDPPFRMQASAHGPRPASGPCRLLHLGPEWRRVTQTKQYQTLLDRLRQREEASFGHAGGVDVDVDDVRPHGSAAPSGLAVVVGCRR